MGCSGSSATFKCAHVSQIETASPPGCNAAASVVASQLHANQPQGVEFIESPSCSPRAPSTSTNRNSFLAKKDSLTMCRFCLCGEGEQVHASEELDEFVSPCLCIGSGGCVHIGCLVKHFEARGDLHNFKCPTCKHIYDGKALRCLAQLSVAKLTKKHGEESLQVANPLHHLARSQCQLGSLSESKTLFELSLKITDQHLGRNSEGRAAKLGNLASVHSELGDGHKARELLQEALTNQEKHHGRGHVGSATILNNLALVCGETGDLQAMKQYLEKSLAIKDAHYGVDHPESSLTLANLGIACSALGENVLATDFTRRSFAACKMGDSPTSRRQIVVFLRATIVRRALGEASKAEEMASSALSSVVEVLGQFAGAQTLRQEVKRSSRLWSVHGRQDMVRWLEIALSVDRLCMEI